MAAATILVPIPTVESSSAADGMEDGPTAIAAVTDTLVVTAIGAATATVVVTDTLAATVIVVAMVIVGVVTAIGEADTLPGASAVGTAVAGTAKLGNANFRRYFWTQTGTDRANITEPAHQKW
jgi:hypothetical protein